MTQRLTANFVSTKLSSLLTGSIDLSTCRALYKLSKALSEHELVVSSDKDGHWEDVVVSICSQFTTPSMPNLLRRSLGLLLYHLLSLVNGDLKFPNAVPDRFHGLGETILSGPEDLKLVSGMIVSELMQCGIDETSLWSPACTEGRGIVSFPQSDSQKWIEHFQDFLDSLQESRLLAATDSDIFYALHVSILSEHDRTQFTSAGGFILVLVSERLTLIVPPSSKTVTQVVDIPFVSIHNLYVTRSHFQSPSGRATEHTASELRLELAGKKNSAYSFNSSSCSGGSVTILLRDLEETEELREAVRVRKESAERQSLQRISNSQTLNVSKGIQSPPPSGAKSPPQAHGAIQAIRETSLDMLGSGTPGAPKQNSQEDTSDHQGKLSSPNPQVNPDPVVAQPGKRGIASEPVPTPQPAIAFDLPQEPPQHGQELPNSPQDGPQPRRGAMRAAKQRSPYGSEPPSSPRAPKAVMLSKQQISVTRSSESDSSKPASKEAQIAAKTREEDVYEFPPESDDPDYAETQPRRKSAKSKKKGSQAPKPRRKAPLKLQPSIRENTQLNAPKARTKTAQTSPAKAHALRGCPPEEKPESLSTGTPKGARAHVQNPISTQGEAAPPIAHSVRTPGEKQSPNATAPLKQSDTEPKKALLRGIRGEESYEDFEQSVVSFPDVEPQPKDLSHAQKKASTKAPLSAAAKHPSSDLESIAERGHDRQATKLRDANPHEDLALAEAQVPHTPSPAHVCGFLSSTRLPASPPLFNDLLAKKPLFVEFSAKGLRNQGRGSLGPAIVRSHREGTVASATSKLLKTYSKHHPYAVKRSPRFRHEALTTRVSREVKSTPRLRAVNFLRRTNPEGILKKILSSATRRHENGERGFGRPCDPPSLDDNQDGPSDRLDFVPVISRKPIEILADREQSDPLVSTANSESVPDTPEKTLEEGQLSRTTIAQPLPTLDSSGQKREAEVTALEARNSKRQKGESAFPQASPRNMPMIDKPPPFQSRRSLPKAHLVAVARLVPDSQLGTAEAEAPEMPNPGDSKRASTVSHSSPQNRGKGEEPQSSQQNPPSRIGVKPAISTGLVRNVQTHTTEVTKPPLTGLQIPSSIGIQQQLRKYVRIFDVGPVVRSQSRHSVTEQGSPVSQWDLANGLNQLKNVQYLLQPVTDQPMTDTDDENSYYEPLGPRIRGNNRIPIPKCTSESQLVDILSSNSKPLPRSPQAESKAISGYARQQDVEEAEEKAERKSPAADPFSSLEDRPQERTVFMQMLHSRVKKPEEAVNIEAGKAAGNDLERALAEGAFDDVLYDIESMTSGTSATDVSFVAEEAVDEVEEERDTEQLRWKASLTPHQRSMVEILSRIARQLISHLDGSSAVLNDIVGDYQRDAGLLVSDFHRAHKAEVDRHLESQQQRHQQMAHEIEQSRSLILDTRQSVIDNSIIRTADKQLGVDVAELNVLEQVMRSYAV